MAITRKNIKAILPDIEDDALKNLLTLIHEETDSLKDANDDLQKQLDDSKKDAETAKTEKEQAETALNDYKTEQGKKEAQTKKNTAIAKLLKEAGIAEKHVPLIAKAVDSSAWELGDDGKFKAENDHVDAIKKDFADYISTTKTNGAKVDNPPAGDPARKYSSREQIMEIKDTTARQKAIAENHDLFGF